MKFVPKRVSRLGHRSALKISKKSPTILVVGGVIGGAVTVVMAARASRKAEVVMDAHRKERVEIGEVPAKGSVPKEVRREKQTEVLELYYNTTLQLTKVYGPTFVVGTLSGGSILWGHRILTGRHMATLAAYSGLSEQFAAYRNRVAKTIGERAEKDVYNGAFGEYVEDPEHKGEYKMKPNWSEADVNLDYCRPWFDETNINHKRDPEINRFWLTGVQSHMNQLLMTRGHLFLNEVFDALHMERCAEGQVMGWVLDNPEGDSFVDFGFMTSEDPQTAAFNDGMTADVRLNFNVDSKPVWDLI